jgi:excisionase family DNA binding protein
MVTQDITLTCIARDGNGQRYLPLRSLFRCTMTVHEAGRRLGLSRNSAYAAAARGEIPAIRIGKRLLVPIKALERLLRGETDQQKKGAA